MFRQLVTRLVWSGAQKSGSGLGVRSTDRCTSLLMLPVFLIKLVASWPFEDSNRVASSNDYLVRCAFPPPTPSTWHSIDWGHVTFIDASFLPIAAYRLSNGWQSPLHRDIDQLKGVVGYFQTCTSKWRFSEKLRQLQYEWLAFSTQNANSTQNVSTPPYTECLSY